MFHADEFIAAMAASSMVCIRVLHGKGTGEVGCEKWDITFPRSGR